MPFRLEARPEHSRLLGYSSPIVAAALMAGTGFLMFPLLGREPFTALYTFFVAPLSSRNGVAELLLKASPLMLMAQGLAVGFRANVWNIGAEGQLTLGAIGASLLAIRYDGTTSPWLLPAMVAAAAVGGMIWAAIPAFLRTRFYTSEILVTLMLTYVAGLLLSYLVHGPLRDPQGLNFPQSIMFGQSALFPLALEGTRLNASILIALAVTGLAWLFMERSFVGYQMLVGGLSPLAARYAGFSEKRAVWLGLLLGGAVAGLAGVGEVAGPLGQLQPQVSPGYGFAAIIVAFVGRLHPIGIVWASLLMSLLYLGGESAQVSLQLPSAITGMFQGLLLFYLLGCDVFIYYRLGWRRPAAAPRRASA
jgi:general nucleoside transport system permease protein